MSGSFIVSTSAQTTTPSLYVGTDGKVGIGTNGPAYPLDVNGVILGRSTIQGTALVGTSAAYAPIFAGSADNGTVNIQTNRNFTNAGTVVRLYPLTAANSSGQLNIFSINPTYTQTGTAAATDLLINRTETSLGSGAQRIIDAQVAGVSKFVLTNTGNVGIDTTNPNAKLEVNGTISATNLYLGGVAVGGTPDRIVSGTASAIAYSNSYISTSVPLRVSSSIQIITADVETCDGGAAVGTI